MRHDYKLTYGDKYNLVVIYSDFDFPSSHSIPSNEEDIRLMFDMIKVSKPTLCCVCCSPEGESDTPDTFKDMVTWIDYATWEREIKVYSCDNTTY